MGDGVPLARRWVRAHRHGLFSRCAPTDPSRRTEVRRPVGIFGLRRFPLRPDGFAPPAALVITRFFAARASPVAIRSSRCFHRSDPPRLSAGGASRLPQDLTSPVARTGGCEISTLATGLPPTRRSSTAAVHTRIASPSSGLGRGTRHPGRLRLTSSRHEAGNDDSFATNESSSRAAGTPLSRPRAIRPSR